MPKLILSKNLLFEVTDIFGKRIRTSKNWWLHIVKDKHQDISDKLELVKDTIGKPDEVRQSEKKSYIYLYYKKWVQFWICVVTRHLNGDGFLMTAYITTKTKKKGNLLWQKDQK